MIILSRTRVPKTSETFNINGVEFTMILVRGGTFTMGGTSSDPYIYSDEFPTHQVTLSTFAIGQTEVTQALWEMVMGSNPSNHSGTNLPVEMVSWNDCQEFITKLNQMTGKNFRLPTEAEWEYAARGGNKSQGYKYSGSNNVDEVAWYFSNSGNASQPVGTKSPNELGIYDMSGNVYEWCSDWYGAYNADAQTNPTGPAIGTERNFRGGNYQEDYITQHVSFRNSGAVTTKRRTIGMRLAL